MFTEEEKLMIAQFYVTNNHLFSVPYRERGRARAYTFKLYQQLTDTINQATTEKKTVHHVRKALSNLKMGVRRKLSLIIKKGTLEPLESGLLNEAEQLIAQTIPLPDIDSGPGTQDGQWKPRALIKFQEKWMDPEQCPQYASWLRRHPTSVYFAYCALCKCQISISNSGKTQVDSHMRSKVHVQSSLGQFPNRPRQLSTKRITATDSNRKEIAAKMNVLKLQGKVFVKQNAMLSNSRSVISDFTSMISTARLAMFEHRLSTRGMHVENSEVHAPSDPVDTLGY